MPKSDKKSKEERLVDSLASFLQEKNGKPESVSISDGWYQGLPEWLSKSKLNPSNVNVPIINKAWKKFKQGASNV